MNDPADHADHVADVLDAARAVEDTARHLCRITVSRPHLTPADVDLVLAHLAAAVASLPQTAHQLADILDQAKNAYDLSTDSLVPTGDADLLIDTARLHLDGVREPAITLHHHLNTAQNQAAHLVAEDCATHHPPPTAPLIDPVHRPQHQPPRSPGGRRGPSIPR